MKHQMSDPPTAEEIKHLERLTDRTMLAACFSSAFGMLALATFVVGTFWDGIPVWATSAAGKIAVVLFVAFAMSGFALIILLGKLPSRQDQ